MTEFVQFSPRQLEVLRLIAQGVGHKEIAFRLQIRPQTEKAHVAAIAAKLGLSSSFELRTWAETYEDAVRTGEPAPRVLHPEGCSCDARYCAGVRLRAA